MKTLTPKPDKITVHHPVNKSKPRSPHHISDEEWKEAEVWAQLSEQFPSGRKHDESHVASIVKEKTDKSYRTFRRYRSEYEKHGTISALCKKVSSGGRGKGRLDSKVDAIIEKHLKAHRAHNGHEDFFVSEAIADIFDECDLEGLVRPSKSVIYNRNNSTSKYKAAKQGGASRLELSKLDATPGKTPERKHPLERVQIDHTLVDVVCGARYNNFHQVQELVPIGRPWMTVALCEATRAPLGLMLSYEAPSCASIAHFMAHMIFPKDDILAEHDLSYQWPMQGIPGIIYTDSGSDFTSNAFKRGCAEIGIQSEVRPGGSSNYGGIIESYIGKSMGKVKLCSGATNKKFLGRGSTRNPAEEASMTISALEQHLIRWAVGVYNNQSKKILHEATPANAWKKGISNSVVSRTREKQMPKSRVDTVINFLPAAPKGRKINDDGCINLHSLRYFSESIRHLRRNGDKKKFEIRFSKYDVSVVWLRDPDTNAYHKLQSLELNEPLTYAEWMATKTWLHKRNITEADVQTRLRAHREMRLESEKSKSESKRSKRKKATQQAKGDQLKKILSRSDTNQQNAETNNIEVFLPLNRKGQKSSKVLKRTHK